MHDNWFSVYQEKAGDDGAAAGGGAAGDAGGATGGDPGAAGDAAGATGASWLDSLDDDTKGFVENKGWKEPTDILTGYRNLEKLVGAPEDKILRLPGEDDAAGWSDVFNKLGRPEAAADYDITVPEGIGDPEMADWAKEAFHKAGLTAAQAKAFTDEWNAYTGGKFEAMKAEYNARVQEEETSLKKEWGAAFDKNVDIARRAAREFGIEAEQLDAMEKAVGFSGLLKLMNRIGSKLGEDSFEGSSSGAGFGAMTPAQATAEMETLRNDDRFRTRYLNGDKDAVAKMDRLMRFANGA